MRISYLILITFWTSTVLCQVDKCDFKVFYNPDNTKREEGCVENDKRVGLWKDYTEGTNKVRFIWTYTNGIKHGPYKALYEDGSIEALGRYTDGTIDDSLKLFNKKGELVEIQIWKGQGISSSLVKTITIGDIRPDGTVDVVDGKIYIWRDGKKIILETIDKSDTRKKNRKKQH